MWSRVQKYNMYNACSCLHITHIFIIFLHCLKVWHEIHIENIHVVLHVLSRHSKHVMLYIAGNLRVHVFKNFTYQFTTCRKTAYYNTSKSYIYFLVGLVLTEGTEWDPSAPIRFHLELFSKGQTLGYTGINWYLYSRICYPVYVLIFLDWLIHTSIS